MQIHGDGSIHPMESKSRYKCRKWRLFVNTECGKKSRVMQGTWTDARNALEAFKCELADKIPASETFQAYAASWLLWRDGSGDYAPGTIANNKRDVDALCRSQLSTAKLEDITPQMCRDCLLWIKTHPVRKSGELSNTTMNKLHVTLHSILGQAVDDGRLPANPLAKIRAPKPDTKERPWMTPDELQAFISRLSTLPLDGRVMALYFMAMLGLRRGEACALSPADVDGNVLCVHLSVKERDGTIGAPKSRASVRFLPMPAPLVDKVDEWNAIRRSRGFSASQTLCCNTRGKVLRPQNLQRWWMGDSKHNGVRDSLGCEGYTLHQLRHSNLSMVARYMSPFDLQRYAGWSSIEPAKVYIHADMTQLEQAISAISWEAGHISGTSKKAGQQPKPLTC